MTRCRRSRSGGSDLWCVRSEHALRVRSSDSATRGSPVDPGPGPCERLMGLEGHDRCACKATHRVYAVTLAGFDGRPAVAGDRDARWRSARCASRSSRSKLGEARVVGHSLGGMLGASCLPLRYPDLLGGVVTVDGLPVFPTHRKRSGRAAIGARRAHARAIRRCDAVASSKRSSSRTCGASA